jgi:ACS family hexuronate transporter-like MFS transporter
MKNMTKSRWLIRGPLFFACAVNDMNRQALGLLKPEQSRKFGWSETGYARMAIFFQLAYAPGSSGLVPS